MEVRTERLVIGPDTPLPLEGIHFRNIAPPSGPDGGAVWNTYALPVGIVRSAFTGTLSSWNSGRGGAVFNSGEMRVSGSSFGQLGAGGGIVATSAPTAWRGGGLFNSGTLSLEGDAFYGASARDGGGALWNEGTASVEGSLFQSGTAQRGGGIANSGTLDIAASRFSGLSASEGGAVWNSGTLRFHGVAIFKDNRAGRGPDIWNSGRAIVEGGAVLMLDGGYDGDGELVFRRGSVLSAAASETSAVLRGSGASSALNIEAGARLRLDGASVGHAYRVADGFGSLGVYGWGEEDVFGSSLLLDARAEPDSEGDGVIVRVAAAPPAVPPETSPGTPPLPPLTPPGTPPGLPPLTPLPPAPAPEPALPPALILPGVIPVQNLHALMHSGIHVNDDSPGRRFLSRATDTGFLPAPADAATASRLINEASRAAATAGVQNTALRLADAASSLLLQRLAGTDCGATSGLDCGTEEDGAKKVEKKEVAEKVGLPHLPGASPLLADAQPIMAGSPSPVPDAPRLMPAHAPYMASVWGAPLYASLRTHGLAVPGSGTRGHFGGLMLGLDFAPAPEDAGGRLPGLAHSAPERSAPTAEASPRADSSAPPAPSFDQPGCSPLRFGFALHGMAGRSQSRGTLCAAQDDAALGGFGVFASWETPEASPGSLPQTPSGRDAPPSSHKGTSFRLDAAALYSFGRHDLRLALPSSMLMPPLAGRADTRVFRAEARASFAFHAGSWRITPHAGVRFTALHTGAHSLGIPEGRVASFGSATQDMTAFPLGLGLGACMELGGWQVAPSAELAFVPTAGSTKGATPLRFSGLDAEDLALSRVADASGFEASLEMEARRGALSLSLLGQCFLSRHEEDAALSFSLRWRF